MATINLPSVGGDDSTWGQKLNDSITAVNTDVESRAVAAGLRYILLWNGSAYASPTGTVATAGNRPTNTFRDFVGPSDPNALGLMIDGDVWKNTAP